VEWIIAAKKDEIKKRRLAVTMEKLSSGKKNYTEA